MADTRPAKVTLSKNLMEMKFMQRRSESNYRKELEEERKRMIDESHWVIQKAGSERGQVEIEPSYIKCEQLYSNGRMSFKNFNPTVEKLFKEMKALDEEMFSEERERETTVSDEEMARRYDTLVGTIGKKFTSKRNRSSTDDSQDRTTSPSHKKKLKAEFMKPKD
ncbi:M-phase phosphoprotein 6 [Exaiptasia diaphana]|uniref:M-phase phosphoprotein 6 n=1 Tax=Exaiptasia diaphana TaxID=2652724 RepID=A0A913WS49_EXADI|nr:M-phase phosphoprotein 6 [Exaiptasia diaphana]KXJ18432.1 M-phase phosphoprotein 6 [Exaiptasia diaphana]